MPIREKFLVFGAPDLGEPEIQAVTEVLRSGWIGTGPKALQFEKEFAAYKGVEDSVAVFSCTGALHLSILAAGIGPGDEVITTPLTFCASVNAIIHAGATPVLADVDVHTMNIDPRQIEKRITSKTKAILPVHFAGRPCEMDEIMALAARYNLVVIEDCAHAIETKYNGKHAGTFGDFGCFSFYVTKNVTCGEGGMILSRSKEQLTRARILRLHGMSADAWNRFGKDGYKHYQVVEAGFKQNMTDMQAAIGLVQLAKVEDSWKVRQNIFNRYNEAFSDLPITTPSAPSVNTRHAYHLYTILIDLENCGIARDQFLLELKNRNIGVGVHYLSIPEHPYYEAKFGWELSDTPNAVKIGRETVSLPLGSNLSDADVDYVIQNVRSILSHGKKRAGGVV